MDLKSILSVPSIYRLYHQLVGSNRCHSVFVNEYVRAKPQARILDIGCGPADILNYMLEVEYIGFDMSQKYINAAQRHFGKRGTFFCQKVETVTVKDLERFDLVIAHGVIHHLSDKEASQLFKLAQTVLKPTGRLLTLDGCFVQRQSYLAKLFISLDRGKYVRTPIEYSQLASISFSNIKTAIRHDLLRIPYTIIIMECSNQPPSPRRSKERENNNH